MCEAGRNRIDMGEQARGACEGTYLRIVKLRQIASREEVHAPEVEMLEVGMSVEEVQEAIIEG